MCYQKCLFSSEVYTSQSVFLTEKECQIHWSGTTKVTAVTFVADFGNKTTWWKYHYPEHIEHDRLAMCLCLHFSTTKVTAVTLVVPYQ